ncbi:hypothetical protein MM239_19940 [Belliella sp. DSM 111904]|uniref:Uncharacterized protein n=1 Tax=Belliella filtrata TaxID=2923435 RepID=A0ABS9V6U6_9BACT|nr:hypothetical protein [Belliella filtrata]MCH7411668.1 hypothetical protein [Belliella filtrata]
MKRDKILEIPVLKRGWKYVAYLFYPLPFLLPFVIHWLGIEWKIKELLEFTYSSWAIASTILILSAHDREDEMIEQFRLRAFQMGFYWLIWGLGAIMLVHFISNISVGFPFGPTVSAPSVLFMQSTYALLALKYQIWKSNRVQD